MSDAELLLLVESRKKSGWLAAFLNLFIPGAGYAYCGNWVLGAVAFLCVPILILVTLTIAFYVFAPLLFIDGFLAANRYNRNLIRDVLKERADGARTPPESTRPRQVGSATPRMSQSVDSLPAPTSRQERECPHCAEMILGQAKLCKHCGRDVVPLDNPPADRATHARVEARPREPFRMANAIGTDSDSLLVERGIAGAVALILLAGFAYWKLNDKTTAQHESTRAVTVATRPPEAQAIAPSTQSPASAVVSESGPPPFPYAVYIGKVANSTMPNISATLTIYFNFVADSLSGRADIGPELAGGGVFSARTTTDSLFLISTSSAGDTIRWAAGRDAGGHYSGTYTVTGGRSSGQGGIWEVEHSSGGDLQFVPRKND
jgi:hypothetical protein